MAPDHEISTFYIGNTTMSFTLIHIVHMFIHSPKMSFGGEITDIFEKN